jgi:L-asparaginase II
MPIIRMGDVALYVRSMGKALQVLAIAETDAEANAYCAKHDHLAVVACVGHLVLLADKYDPGITIPRTPVA